MSNSGHVGVFSLLTILFVGLKLGNVITWSWWWVLSPAIIGFGIIIIAIGTVWYLLSDWAKIKGKEK